MRPRQHQKQTLLHYQSNPGQRRHRHFPLHPPVHLNRYRQLMSGLIIQNIEQRPYKIGRDYFALGHLAVLEPLES